MRIALAVVIRKNRVLIQHRKRGNLRVYEFPGGRAELSERFVQAAQRELLEETGLFAIDPDSAESFVLTTESGAEVGFVRLRVSSEQEPQMTDSRREQSFQWMALNEIPSREFHQTDQLFIASLLPKWLAHLE
jgi:8-oxo-dGTP pyrophosphatase MutT (NUDIX family)